MVKKNIITSSLPPRRRLVAIMFTDIEGYTALMQKSEEQALLYREVHRKIFNQFTDQFNGEIIQYYGDGTLSIFESAVDAVQCGIAMQLAFQNDSAIPVRIGIHTGDVVLTEDDIIGDGVNIASRIESLAVKGSVLVSEKVFDEIKNTDSIKTTYLSSFRLKNVSTKIGVYAIANEGLNVPRLSDIRGKIEPSGRVSIIASLLPAILIIVSIWLIWGNMLGGERLPKEILESRMAVLPFENRTNDNNLDMLGNMAADWIVQALMNFDNFKVVSPETINKHLPYFTSDTIDPLSFEERTGAEKIISGSFYKDGNQLVFQIQLIDAKNRETKFVFPEIIGASSDIGGLVRDIRERVLSYFFISKNPGTLVSEVFLENPPKFEAYKAFLEGRDMHGRNYSEARVYFNKAIELDSSFFYPYWMAFNTYFNQFQLSKADSIIHLIERRFKQLKPYEQLFLNLAKEVVSMDQEAAYQAAHKLFLKDPKHPRLNYVAGLSAVMANKPGKAVEHFEAIDPRSITIEVESDSWWFDAYAYGLIRLNRLEEALILIQDLPVESVSWGVIYRMVHVFVLMDQQERIHNLINELDRKNFPMTLIHGLQNAAISWYAIKKDPRSQMYWADLTIRQLLNMPESIGVDSTALAEAYYYSGQYNKALPFYLDGYQQSSHNTNMMVRLACCYAQTGQEDRAIEIIDRLKNMESNSSYGQYKYALGLIYAMLGEKETSVEYLKSADREGMPFLPNYFDGAYELIPLHGYTPYEKFVSPKI